jgi:hypothetical protein
VRAVRLAGIRIMHRWRRGRPVIEATGLCRSSRQLPFLRASLPPLSGKLSGASR